MLLLKCLRLCSSIVYLRGVTSTSEVNKNLIIITNIVCEVVLLVMIYYTYSMIIMGNISAYIVIQLYIISNCPSKFQHNHVALNVLRTQHRNKLDLKK